MLDETVRSFRERPLDGKYRYVWLDAVIFNWMFTVERARRKLGRVYPTPVGRESKPQREPVASSAAGY